MLIGFSMFIAGWALLFISSDLKNVWVDILCTMLIEAGNSFSMMPATTLGANSLKDELIPHGSSIIATVRQVLGSSAIVLATVILGDHNFKAVF